MIKIRLDQMQIHDLLEQAMANTSL